MSSAIEASLSRYISLLGMRVNNYIVISIPITRIIKILSILKNTSFFSFLVLTDLWVVDYLENNQRFQVNYLLYSPYSTIRLHLILYASANSKIPSINALFKSSLWLEREVWDLYGLFFVDHPDLRRILSDYGFEGHPMRKDFPLSGYLEVRYNDEIKKIVFEPLKLSQEFRYFNFLSPWENKQIN